MYNFQPDWILIRIDQSEQDEVMVRNLRGYYQLEGFSEPETEWMQFGPNSWNEIVELNEDDIKEKKEVGYMNICCILYSRNLF